MTDITFMQWSGYITIIILIFITFFLFICNQVTEVIGNGKLLSQSDGNGTLYALGRPSETEDLTLIIDRIEWSTYLEQRSSKYQRVFLISCCITVAISLFIFQSLPDVFEILAILIVTFSVLYICNNFYYVHGDIHRDANIREGLRILRIKLALNKSKTQLPLPTSSPLQKSDID